MENIRSAFCRIGREIDILFSMIKESETTAFCSFIYNRSKTSLFPLASFITKKKREGDKSMTEEIMEVLNGQVFGVWFLIGAALVFWMQAGFGDGGGRFYQSEKHG